MIYKATLYTASEPDGPVASKVASVLVCASDDAEAMEKAHHYWDNDIRLLPDYVISLSEVAEAGEVVIV